MRDRIKALAQDLLIQRGCRGMSFGDLAGALGTTRANIHYHFGNKQALVEEVLVDYVRETLEAMREIWVRSDAPLVEKIRRNVEYSRQRYLRYNRPGREGHNWSLIARMRQDGSFLTQRGHQALQEFADELSACITAAIEEAKRKKEFVAWMPAEDVALQLCSIANSAAPITLDAGNFDRLEQLYLGFTRILVHAFGAHARRPGTPAGRMKG
ncbi:MAG: TetR/AcrR family transcriptional regulator, partial [Rhodospirillaceae bacterium]|nr:TetR/AcrR family transcriptional regulator [Rhodospirillaceae bacterium]